MRLLLLVSVTAALGGCRAYDATELMVTVQTRDLAHAPGTPPYAIDEIEVRILRLNPPGAGLRDAGVGVSDAGAGQPMPCATDAMRVPGYVTAEKWCGRYVLPFDGVPPVALGVVPDDGDESTGQIQIHATARHAGAYVVDTFMNAAYSPHRRVYLPPLVLSGGCVGAVCPPGQVCNDNACVTPTIPPACLLVPGGDGGPFWSTCGGDASTPTADAGPPDAGPPEGGPPEAGTDAGVEAGTDSGGGPPPCGPGHCGNGRCDCGENYCDCAADCSGSGHACASHCGLCGCDCTETCATCPSDCC